MCFFYVKYVFNVSNVLVLFCELSYFAVIMNMKHKYHEITVGIRPEKIQLSTLQLHLDVIWTSFIEVICFFTFQPNVDVV